MAVQLTVPVILNIANVCQYLQSANIGRSNAMEGGVLDERRARLIYMERVGIQNRYNLNPNDPTLPGVANYLFSILEGQSQAQRILANQSISNPVLTGPTDQSVNVGDNATFSVSVSGTGPFTYQWFVDNVVIPGATSSSYIKTNAQLLDSGEIYTVQVTGPNGNPVMSGPATLTVTAAITGLFTYSDTTDFYPVLLTNSDPFTYPTSYSITHNAPIVITLPPAMPANQYMLAKVPVGESVKTIWNNTVINNGVIPDIVFEPIVQFGGFTYYASRGKVSMDTTQPLTLS